MLYNISASTLLIAKCFGLFLTFADVVCTVDAMYNLC